MTRGTILVTALLLAGASCTGEEKTPAPASSDAGDAGGPAPDSASTEDAGVGETCIGYGSTGDTCTGEQGKPYGYVCFNGPPPGIQGCKLTRENASLGNNYCCEENLCVEQVDQSAACAGVLDRPHRFQCPPEGAGNATAPEGCVEHDQGESAVEKYYCCP